MAWRRHKLARILLSGCLLAVSSITGAQEKSQCALPDCDQAKTFFAKFQHAVDANQKQDVAGMVRYPLRSYRNGKATVFKTKAELLARYDTVFTPGVRCAIKSATPADVWAIGAASPLVRARSGGTASFPTRPRAFKHPIWRSIRLECLASITHPSPTVIARATARDRTRS